MTTTITTCLTIRSADPGEATALEGLQRRSSTVGEGGSGALSPRPDAIAIDRSAIADGRVRVVHTTGGVVIGFSVVERTTDGACELDGLFVEPAWMRRGVARLLVADAIARSRERGARRFDVVADPRAAAAYARLGFRGGDGNVVTRCGPVGRMHLVI